MQSPDLNTKILLASAVSGQVFQKTYDELYSLLNYITKGNPGCHGDTSRGMIKNPTCMIGVDSIIDLDAQLTSFQIK